MERLNENDIEIPRSKSYLRSKLFHEYINKECAPEKMFFNISECDGEKNVVLKMLKKVVTEEGNTSGDIVVCTSDVTKKELKNTIDCSHIQFVKMDSDKFIQAIATAKYVVSDSSMPTYYVRRKEQKYVYVCVREAHQQAVEADDTLYICKDNLISNLLNASYIVSPSRAFTDAVLIEKYKLAPIYEGIIIEGNENLAEDTCITDLISTIQGMKIRTSLEMRKVNQTEKKKIILVEDHNYFMDTSLWKYTSIFENINTDKYDITVLNVSKVTEESKREIQNVNKKLRVIQKFGRVNYSDEAYIQLQKSRYAFRQVDDIEKVLEYRPTEELKNEWNRLIGDAQFDIAIMTSMQSVFWYEMFTLLENTKKFITRAFAPELSLSALEKARIFQLNTVRICNYFDRVITFDEDIVKLYKDSGLLQKDNMFVFDDEYCLLRSYKEYPTVTINNRKYWSHMTAQKDSHILEGVYLIQPKEGHKAIFIGIEERHLENLDLILSGLYSYIDQNIEVEIYLGMPYSNKEDAIEGFAINASCKDRIHIVYNFMASIEWLEYMDAMVAFTHTEEKRYKYISNLLGKHYRPIKLVNGPIDEKAIQEALEQVFSTEVNKEESNYLVEQQEEIDSLFA